MAEAVPSEARDAGTAGFRKQTCSLFGVGGTAFGSPWRRAASEASVENRRFPTMNLLAALLRGGSLSLWGTEKGKTTSPIGRVERAAGLIYLTRII